MRRSLPLLAGKRLRGRAGRALRLPRLRLPGARHGPGRGRGRAPAGGPRAGDRDAGGPRLHRRPRDRGRHGALRRAPCARACRTASRRSARPGSWCSRLGFGGYRVDDETPEHREALAHALARGRATSSTPRRTTRTAAASAWSARSCARADRRRRRCGATRSSSSPRSATCRARTSSWRAAARGASRRPFPEMVKYGEGIWHCIHPEFLRGPARALAGAAGPRDARRLPAAQPRVLPEGRARAQPRHARAAPRGVLRAPARGVRLARGRGRGRPPAVPTASRRTRSRRRRTIRRRRRSSACWRGAPRPGGHFRVLQLPMNLLEAGAVARAQPGPGPRRARSWSVAAAAGVGVLVNRPLNAWSARAASCAWPTPPPAEAAADWEAQLAARRGAGGRSSRPRSPRYIQTEDGSRARVQFFRWAHDLRGLDAQVKSARALGPAREPAHRAARERPCCRRSTRASSGALAEQWGDWRGRYLPELQDAAGRGARPRGREERAERRASFATPSTRRCLPERRAEPLSRLALWVGSPARPGVSSVLVGHAPRRRTSTTPCRCWPGRRSPTPPRVLRRARRRSRWRT